MLGRCVECEYYIKDVGRCKEGMYQGAVSEHGNESDCPVFKKVEVKSQCKECRNATSQPYQKEYRKRNKKVIYELIEDGDWDSLRSVLISSTDKYTFDQFKNQVSIARDIVGGNESIERIAKHMIENFGYEYYSLDIEISYMTVYRNDEINKDITGHDHFYCREDKVMKG